MTLICIYALYYIKPLLKNIFHSRVLFPFVFFLLFLFFILFVFSTTSYTNTMHDHSHQYPLPCLYCHPYSYIRMVIYMLDTLSLLDILLLPWLFYSISSKLVLNFNSCMENINAGSKSHREMHALSHEPRPVHKGTGRTCRD